MSDTHYISKLKGDEAKCAQLRDKEAKEINGSVLVDGYCKLCDSNFNQCKFVEPVSMPTEKTFASNVVSNCTFRNESK